MATFAKRPSAPKPPPPDAAVDLAALAETIAEPAPAAAPDPALVPVEEPARRTKGRPPSPEARVVFGTRLKAETITDVEALKAGLRLKMQGEAIERAVAFYRAHVIAKVRAELCLGPDISDEAALTKAFKVDD